MIGQIVCSKAGRDKGYFLVVTEEQGNFVLVCDGKERPIERPKKKNVKHLAFTGKVLDKDCFKSNKGLRIALAVFRDTADKERN